MLEGCPAAGQDSALLHPYLRQTASMVSSTSMDDNSNHKHERQPKDFTGMSAGMSAQELQALCFPEDFSLASSKLPVTLVLGGITAESSVVSDEGTEKTSNENKNSPFSSSGIHTALSLEDLQKVSEDANSRVSQEIKSREGKTLQRWAVDPHSNGRILRLVAGCVPILGDGRVLLIRSANKETNGWLVPKGGWEQDECLEEGAIRECFEEAGVLGVLGPNFNPFYVETRKARRRRMELEEKLRQKPETLAPDSEFYSGWSVLSQLSEEDHLTDETSYASEEATKVSSSPSSAPVLLTSISSNVLGAPKTGVKVTFQLAEAETGPIACDLNQLIPAVDVFNSEITDETASTSSLTHTHTCTTLFPLYVQQVQESWPESSRTRRAFDIDDAIQIVRPEFRPLLEKAKEQGLHLLGLRST